MKNSEIKKFLKSDAFALLNKFVDCIEQDPNYNSKNDVCSLICSDYLTKYSKMCNDDIGNTDEIINNSENFLQNRLHFNYDELFSDTYVQYDKETLLPLIDAIQLLFRQSLVSLKDLPADNSSMIDLGHWQLLDSSGNSLSRAKIEKLFLTYIYDQNKTSEESYEEFYKSIRDYLRLEIINKYQRSDNSNKLIENNLTEDEKKNINSIRQKVLYYYDGVPLALSGDQIDIEVLYGYIQECSEAELKTLIEELDKVRQGNINYHYQEIDELNTALNKIIDDMRKEKTRKAREEYRDPVEFNMAEQKMHQKIIDLYESYDSYEWVYPCATEAIKEGRIGKLSNRISHKFNGAVPSSDDAHMKMLIYLINAKEMERLGYWQKGISLRRKTSYLIDDNFNYVTQLKPLEKLQIYKHLSEIDYSKQSNLILRNSSTETGPLRILDTICKSEQKKGRSGALEDINWEWSLIVDRASSPTTICVPGVYVKIKKENKTKKTMELALFKFIDDNIDCGVQLYRAEKTYSLWKEDGPAEHNLYGGEKITAYKHLHTYNELDAVSRKEKELGYMDPSHVLSRKITDDAFELWFDSICGITNSGVVQKRFQDMINVDE